MQTIFITGASSGIGKETAKLFSAKGWRVIATMRNLRKGEDLAGLPNVVLMPFIALPRDGAYGAAKRAQQGMVESIYYELKPFGVSVKAMIPGGTKTNFQTPVNDLTGYEEPAARQRKYLLDGNDEFPNPQEAANIIFEAATDGKDKLHYPTDSVCQKLYDEYMGMNIEDFKTRFYHRLFD